MTININSLCALRGKIEQLATQAERLQLFSAYLILIALSEAIIERRLVDLVVILAPYQNVTDATPGNNARLREDIERVAELAKIDGFGDVQKCLLGIANAITIQADRELQYHCGVFLRMLRSRRFDRVTKMLFDPSIEDIPTGVRRMIAIFDHRWQRILVRFSWPAMKRDHYN